MAKKKKANSIILIVVAILVIVILAVLLILEDLNSLKENISSNSNVAVVTDNTAITKLKTAQEIIDATGSKYLGESGTIEHSVFVDFKYNLFDEDGKSKKDFFYGIIEEMEEIENKTFYLVDEQKNIKISAIYKPSNQTYKILINNIENYYSKVDGDEFNMLLKLSYKMSYSEFPFTNGLIQTISLNSSHYKNTELDRTDKEQLDNGYYSYDNGIILAKLQHGKALNIIFRDGYEGTFAQGITVKTDLSTIYENYPNPSFGSVRDRYLGYITQYAYIFFYDDEVSVYPFTYKENKYFEKYITDFCNDGDFTKFVSNFAESSWTSYFVKEYDEKAKTFKITFPTQGLKVDIINNDTKGITLYNNYYLTESLKDLIKAKKITFEANKDLVDVTERARREAM